MNDGITQRGWMESTPTTARGCMMSGDTELPLGHIDLVDPSYDQPNRNLKFRDPEQGGYTAVEKVDSKNATKFDQGKADWSQVPFSGLEGMVAVLEFGAKKYAKANWTTGGGFSHTRVLNSCMRHMFAYMEGENNDPESGLSHVHHAQCNLLFLAFYKKHPDKFPKDDRTVFISEQ